MTLQLFLATISEDEALATRATAITDSISVSRYVLKLRSRANVIFRFQKYGRQFTYYQDGNISERSAN